MALDTYGDSYIGNKECFNCNEKNCKERGIKNLKNNTMSYMLYNCK